MKNDSLNQEDYKLSTFRKVGLKARWVEDQYGEDYIVAKGLGVTGEVMICGVMFEDMMKYGVVNIWKNYTRGLI